MVNASLLDLRWDTITRRRAKKAIREYNSGSYEVRGLPTKPNIQVDHEFAACFLRGLGSGQDRIQKQVEFVGKNYGGMAGTGRGKVAIPAIASEIARNAANYRKVASSAPALLESSWTARLRLIFVDGVEYLIMPFDRQDGTYLSCASKFWQGLRPDSFPIFDSCASEFFLVQGARSSALYVRFIERVWHFGQRIKPWLDELREIDRQSAAEEEERYGEHWQYGSARSDIKLLDKIAFECGKKIKEMKPA